jgi:RNA polymerase sigma-70 factor, ECF subfamily
MRADVDALAAMLADEAIIAMPPMASWFRGREAVADFLRWAFEQRHGTGTRIVPAHANGQLAFGTYRWNDDAQAFRGHNIQVLTLDDDGRIAELVGFVDGSLFPRFGLPQELR